MQYTKRPKESFDVSQTTINSICEALTKLENGVNKIFIYNPLTFPGRLPVFCGILQSQHLQN